MTGLEKLRAEIATQLLAAQLTTLNGTHADPGKMKLRAEWAVEQADLLLKVLSKQV